MLRSLLLLLALLPPGEEGRSVSRSLILDRATDEQRLLLRNFELPPGDFEWSLQPRSEGDQFARFLLRFPSPVDSDVAENDVVWAHYWMPKGERRPSPAVVVLHWMGGNFAPLENICTKLAEDGLCVLMPYLPGYGPRRSPGSRSGERMIVKDLDVTSRNLRQAVLDIRRCGDWLASRPEVEPLRIGILGVSLGAILGSLTAGIDSRFEGGAFLIGGGDLAAIVTNPSRETREIRKGLADAGVSMESLRERWQALDPITFASRLRPESVLLVNAEKDEIIPPLCSRLLQETIGTPNIEWIPGGHYDLLFQIHRIVPRLSAHLRRKILF